MAKISRDLSAGNLHPRETLYAAGLLVTINSELTLAVDGCNSFAMDVRGTYTTGVLIVEGTVDGTNWNAIPMRPYNQAGVLYLLSPAAATAGLWMGRCSAFRTIRARMATGATVGGATVTLAASSAALDNALQDRITPSRGTNTGAAGAAVTLTLTSPGAGLRHYITSLKVQRFAAALLVAGATPVLVTTTNIPGTLVLSIPADAAAAGSMYTETVDCTFPIATVAQGTNTTIVAPVTTNVIWRISAGFYAAP